MKQLRKCSPDSASAFASRKDQSTSLVRCSEQESDSESSSSPALAPSQGVEPVFVGKLYQGKFTPSASMHFHRLASCKSDSYTIHLPSSIYRLGALARALLSLRWQTQFSGGS